MKSITSIPHFCAAKNHVLSSHLKTRTKKCLATLGTQIPMTDPCDWYIFTYIYMTFTSHMDPSMMGFSKTPEFLPPNPSKTTGEAHRTPWNYRYYRCAPSPCYIKRCVKITLQGINISHLRKRKIIFKMPFLGDMLVPWRAPLVFAP